jgi:hypothetical protein
MAIVNVGYICNGSVDGLTGSPGTNEDLVFISEYNPAAGDGTYATFCIRTSNSELSDAIDIWIQFAFYEKEDIGGGNYKFIKGSTSDKFKITRTWNGSDVTWTANSSDVWFNKNGSPYQQTVTFDGGDIVLTKLYNQNVEAANGERIGVIFSGAESWGSPPGYYVSDFVDTKSGIGGYHYTFYSNDYSFRTDEDPYSHDAGALALSIVGTSGTVADACQLHDENYYMNETMSGYGSMTVAGFSGDNVVANLITPWGESLPAELFYDGVTRQFDDDSGMEHWSLKLNGFSGPPSFCYDPYECWWSDKSIYYVKTGGSDSNFGGTWATAFKTITKGTQTVPDGGTLMIEEGTYNNETQIQPTVDNATYNIQPASHTEAACTVTVNLA